MVHRLHQNGVCWDFFLLVSFSYFRRVCPTLWSLSPQPPLPEATWLLIVLLGGREVKGECRYDLILLEPTKLSVWLMAQGQKNNDFYGYGTGVFLGSALEIDYGSSQTDTGRTRGYQEGERNTHIN